MDHLLADFFRFTAPLTKFRLRLLDPVVFVEVALEQLVSLLTSHRQFAHLKVEQRDCARLAHTKAISQELTNSVLRPLFRDVHWIRGRCDRRYRSRQGKRVDWVFRWGARRPGNGLRCTSFLLLQHVHQNVCGKVDLYNFLVNYTN